MKRCTKCGEYKELTDFYKRNNGKYYRSSCKECEIAAARKWNCENAERTKQNRHELYIKNKKQENESSRKWKQENKERVIESKLLWYYNNRDKAILSSREYRRKDNEAVKQRTAKWFRENKNKACEYVRRRDALKMENRVGVVCYDEILRRDCGICHICGKPVMSKLHFDHIVPLSRGGMHSMDNIAVSHSKCNLRKNNKLLTELNINII